MRSELAISDLTTRAVSEIIKNTFYKMYKSIDSEFYDRNKEASK